MFALSELYRALEEPAAPPAPPGTFYEVSAPWSTGGKLRLTAAQVDRLGRECSAIQESALKGAEMLRIRLAPKAGDIGALSMNIPLEHALEVWQKLGDRLDELGEITGRLHPPPDAAGLMDWDQAARERGEDPATGDLRAEIVRLRAAIRKHRDARGDDADAELYAVLGEPIPTPRGGKQP
jgi:hypothetical protein